MFGLVHQQVGGVAPDASPAACIAAAAGLGQHAGVVAAVVEDPANHAHHQRQVAGRLDRQPLLPSLSTLEVAGRVGETTTYSNTGLSVRVRASASCRP